MTNKKSFNPGRNISIFFMFFSLLFFLLGLWQIERGQNKQEVLDLFAEGIKAEPSTLSSQSQKWQRVNARGTLDGTRQIYIDNVVHKGRVGFKVLTPLKIDGEDRPILVDRGWIEKNANISVLPDISLSQKKIEVSGLLVKPELGFVLSDNLITASWPKISQTQSLDYITKEYKEEIYPFILVAEPTYDDALTYMDVIPTNMPAVKHYGYALQWFSMFIVLCGMYLYVGFKRR